MGMSVIKLRNGEAQSFFEMMSHPDPKVLQARDTFLKSLCDSTTLNQEGASLVMDIPAEKSGVSLFSNGCLLHHVTVQITIKPYTPAGDYSCSFASQNERCEYGSSFSDFLYFDGNCPDAA